MNELNRLFMFAGTVIMMAFSLDLGWSVPRYGVAFWAAYACFMLGWRLIALTGPTERNLGASTSHASVLPSKVHEHSPDPNP